MGMFSKSLLILLVAVSTPLLYRQFATDNAIKFMSSYYSNYKVIDQFLRQSASQLDKAKDYLPNKEQVENLVDKSKTQVNAFVGTIKEKIDEFRAIKSEKIDSKQNEQNKGPPKQQQQQSYRMSNCPGEDKQVRLWVKDELAKFDGSSGDEVYLGFLGLVYNVTINMQHYGPGAEYSAFAGRDATRAFVTGNFTHDLHDDISDIEESFYTHVESWASFYSSSYQALGRIEGAFFDSRGCGTRELGRVYEIFNKLAQERAKNREENKLLPECNSEWNSDLNSGRVWCSTQSGGVERDWIGVPRLLLETKDTSKRCVCVNLEAHDSSDQERFKVYPECDPSSSDCTIGKLD